MEQSIDLTSKLLGGATNVVIPDKYRAERLLEWYENAYLHKTVLINVLQTTDLMLVVFKVNDSLRYMIQSNFQNDRKLEPITGYVPTL